MQPDQALLDDIVKRIREACSPLRIILFGSAARGEMTRRSDIDVLVVVADSVRSVDAMKEAYRSMSGLRTPTDIVVVNEKDVARYRESGAHIVMDALNEGRELFHAAQA